MIQDAGTSLQQKALAKFFSRFGERLDRHLATDRFIHSPVNDAHAANAQDAQNLVFADLSNWRTGIHGLTPDSNGIRNQQQRRFSTDPGRRGEFQHTLRRLAACQMHDVNLRRC